MKNEMSYTNEIITGADLSGAAAELDTLCRIANDELANLSMDSVTDAQDGIDRITVLLNHIAPLAAQLKSTTANNVWEVRV